MGIFPNPSNRFIVSSKLKYIIYLRIILIPHMDQTLYTAIAKVGHSHTYPSAHTTFLIGANIPKRTIHWELRVSWFQLPIKWAPPGEGRKPQPWPAVFPFPSRGYWMAEENSLCPKLVNSSNRGCFHVTFEWLNIMQLAKWTNFQSRCIVNNMCITNFELVYSPSG